MSKVKEFFEEQKAARKAEAHKKYLECYAKLEERAAYHEKIAAMGWGEDKPIWTEAEGVTDKAALLEVLAEFGSAEPEQVEEPKQDQLEENLTETVEQASKVSEILMPILSNNKSIKEVNFDGQYLNFKNGAVEKKYYVDNGTIMGKGLTSILFEGLDRDNRMKTFFVPVDQKYVDVLKKGLDGQLTYQDVADIEEYLPDLTLYYTFDLSAVDMTKFPNREMVIGFNNILNMVKADAAKKVQNPRFRVAETEIGFEIISDENVKVFNGSNTVYYTGMKYSVNKQGVWYIMNNQAEKIITFTATPEQKAELEQPMILTQQAPQPVAVPVQQAQQQTA